MFQWEVPTMAKANNLLDFMNVFHPYPLEDDNFKSFYVDTDAIRGSEMRKLEYTCLNSLNPYAKILFSGHTGSGKTTEIYRLASSEEILKKFEVIRIPLTRDLDLYNITYVDFIFEIMSVIILYFQKKHSDKITDSTVDFFNQLYDYWKSEHFKTEFQEVLKDTEANVSSSINSQAGLTIGGKILAKLEALSTLSTKGQGIFKTSTVTKTELRKKLEPSMSELLSGINSMIKGINKLIEPKQLLIIVEDLDKASEISIKEIFVQHIEPIFSLDIKMIYLIPISLELSLKFKRIKDRADANFILNTISIVDQDKRDIIENIEFFKNFVFKRADEQFFDMKALDLLIKKSGGILRDLFYLLTDASLNAVIEHPSDERILLQDAEKACIKLRGEYGKSIETRDQYDRILAIYKNTETTFEDDVILSLLSANVIIECGEERYRIVHPLIIDYMKSKGDIGDENEIDR